MNLFKFTTQEIINLGLVKIKLTNNFFKIIIDIN